MKFAGIDPGQDGGIALITKTTTGVAISVQKLPQKNFRLHIPDFMAWLAVNKPTIISIEQLGCYHHNSRQSIQTAAIGWGKMVGLIEHAKIKYQIYKPQEWQSLVGVPKDDRTAKARSIERVKELYPQVDLMPKGCRTEKDGLADALLIAHAAMKQFERNLGA